MIGKWNFDKSTIKEWGDKIPRLFVSLGRAQKCYFLAAVLLPITLMYWFLPFEQPRVSTLLATLALAGLGVFFDSLETYSKLWGTMIGKAIVTLVYAFCVNQAFAFSGQIVNSVVGVDPSNFTYTLTFVAILLVPLFVAAGLMVILGVVLISGQFVLMAKFFAHEFLKHPVLKEAMAPNREQYPMLTFIARFIAAVVVIGVIIDLARRSAPDYDRFVLRTTAAFAHHFQAYEKIGCAKEPGEKVLPLNDEFIVLSRKQADGEYSFRKVRCVAVPEPNTPMERTR